MDGAVSIHAPTRGATSAKGFRELVLIPALREKGLSVRNARAAIDAVINFINGALRRHERVELPIGTFKAMPRTGPQRARKFGKVITVSDYSIRFLPSAELMLAAAAALPSPLKPKLLNRPTRAKSRQIPQKSDLTLSTELIVEFVRKNVEACNWVPFFSELRSSPSSPARPNQFRPQPNEIRPLGEAAQVIDECAPEDVPEESSDRLSACHEWFARWTRRVIPLALWQQAMHTAEKTLLPKTEGQASTPCS